MAVCGTGWDGVMGLIPGGLPRGHATVAWLRQWDWFMVVCGTGWNGVMGLIHGGLPWGHATLAGWGWRDLFVRARHGAMQHWLDRGDGIDSKGHAMGASDPGWIGAMGSIDGGLRHWLDWGDGIDLWGCMTLGGTGQWHWFMGTRLGDARLDVRWDWFLGARHGGATLAGCGRWAWVMGACHGGVQLDQGDGMDLWGRAMGAHDTD